jgi:Tfp pilus assembly protein PilN
MIRINLAPPPTRKRRFGLPGPGLGLLFGALFAMEVAGLGLYWAILAADMRRLGQEIEENGKEMARLRVIIAEGQRFKQEKEDLERRVNAIETIVRNQARPAYLLDALADLLPGNLWLTRREEKGQQLRLGGATYSSVALADFMANLKASGKFREVDLVESRQDLTKSPRIIMFEVTCRFEI